MRATIRITWLLLSLSFLLHNVSSDDADPADPSGPKDSSTIAPVSVSATSSAGLSGASVTTKKADSVSVTAPTPTAPTTIKLTPTAPTPAVIASTQPKTTDKPASTPQTTTVAIKTTPLSTIISGGPPAVMKTTPAPAATPSPSKSMTTTADSGGASGVSTTAPTTKKNDAPETTKISATEASTRPADSIGKGGTAQTQKVLTDASTQPHQSVTNTPNPPTTSQGGSTLTVGEGTTVKSLEQTTPKASGPAVSTGTTSSNPSTPNTPGLPQKEATTSPQTTIVPTTTTTATASQLRTFSFSLNSGQETEDKELVETCKQLMANLKDGNCTLKLQKHKDKVQFNDVEIHGKVDPKVAARYYEEINKKTDNRTLIAILASCGALLIMIVILAVCASHRRKPYNENQQHLTEELHTVENGYHDNPTLEVMEVQPEMQEKKMPLNGEFNDSWIVPMDNLPKGCEDIPEEEDTHL